MIEIFKNLSTKKKWIVGIIALLIFPITLTLLIADFAINGFKEGKLIKLIIGVFALLIVIGLFWQSSSTVSSSLYDDKVKELNETKSKLKDIQSELKAKEKIIDKSKIYLDLNDNDKNEVDKFIENIKDKEKTKKENQYKKEKGTVEITDTKENKPGTVEIIDSEKASSNSNTSSNNINNSEDKSNEVSYSVEEQQEPQTSGATVYANGGKSKSNKYHSSPTAHNMEGAIGMSESEAKANGYVPCGKCY
ncbi:ABC transporter permease [Paraclostridium sordellii 8483]|uniref:ABC transporter permease n=1 Tax=Paraclostridium sordellii TaxID=1505 RepID=UPI000659BDDA|nr:ABC transporter permease [Paeniclostridium sordellii]TAN63966.1 ABC transporter permease [Paeniclostridium sordellii 8483]